MKYHNRHEDDRNIDIMLRRALKQQTEPDAALQQKVLHQWKENCKMNKNKKWMAAAAAVTCVLAVSVSVGAAGHYLSSRQVAEEFAFGEMSKAFSEGDGIEINETQSYGDYNVTLMGVASGKALGSVHLDGDGNLIDDMTYVVVAIEHADGTPMPDPVTADPDELPDFFVSPLIEGYDPVNFNAFTMHGGATWDVIDGVEYRIAECDNVEMFADHKLHLCVMDQTFYNKAAYNYDSTTGEITPNEAYEGMNLLFDLPIDASKADPQKVEEYLKDFELMFPEVSSSEDNALEKHEELAQGYTDFMTNSEWEQVVKDATCLIEPTVVEKTTDDSYEMDYAVDLPDGSNIAGTFYFFDWEFVDGVEIQKFGTNVDGKECWFYAKGVQNSDGTITVSVYY